MNISGKVILLLTGAAFISGCGGDIKRSLGLRRPLPNEFNVVTAPPLSIPADLKTLPPPGSVTLALVRPPGYIALYGAPPLNDQTETTLEEFIVEKEEIGVPKDIRELIDDEHSRLAKNDSILKKWLGVRFDPTTVVVNSKLEIARLQHNKELGLSMLEGQTPQIVPTDNGIMSVVPDPLNIFN